MRSHHTNNVLLVEGSNISYKGVGVGLIRDSSLMGYFPLSAPTNTSINMISSMVPQSHESIDPWVVPNLSTIELLGDTIPLSPTEATYNAIQSVDYNSYSDDVHLVAPDPYFLLSWLSSPPPSFDYISKPFPSDKFIFNIMSLEEVPWKDHHH